MSDGLSAAQAVPDTTVALRTHEARGDGARDTSDAPPGWTYNPSTWAQRAPVLCVALLNCAIAIYISLIQTGVISYVWDPFFGTGSERVVSSSISRALPIPDAVLGACAYALDILLVVIGGRQRWKTEPWLALAFALVTVPLWLTSVVLLALQPAVVHYWCTLCLIAAVGMLIAGPLSLDEAAAALQYVLKGDATGPDQPWQRLVKGGEKSGSPGRSGRPFQGFSIDLPVAACLALGLWMLLSPYVLHTVGEAAANDFVLGAIIIAIALLACAEVARPARFVCAACGLWLLVIAPWTFAFTAPLTRPNEMVTGAAILVALALRPGRRDRTGMWETPAERQPGT